MKLHFAIRAFKNKCSIIINQYYQFVLNYVTVNIKWGKERFSDVECNTDESPELFKAQLFALSGVPPDRQKVMIKGAVIKVN